MSKRLAGTLVFTAASSVIIAFAAGGIPFVHEPIGAAYLSLWVLWWLVRLLGIKGGASSRYDKRQRVMVVVSGATVIPILIVVPPWEYAHYAGPLSRDGPLSYAGLALFAAGILLQAAATRALQGFYTTRLSIQRSHALVTGGPYRAVRHPGYLSQLLCMAGLGLTMSSLVTLAVTVLVVPLFVWRMDQEEEMLLTKFETEYRAYMQRTRWRLLPRVY